MNFIIPHIGISAENETEAKKIVSLLCSIFDLQVTSENPNGIFVGTQFEIMKSFVRGEKGHVALKVDNVEKALEEFKSKGINSLEETYKYDEENHIRFAYLDININGFMFHLVK